MCVYYYMLPLCVILTDHVTFVFVGCSFNTCKLDPVSPVYCACLCACVCVCAGRIKILY